jgi:hypothetical protein
VNIYLVQLAMINTCLYGIDVRTPSVSKPVHSVIAHQSKLPNKNLPFTEPNTSKAKKNKINETLIIETNFLAFPSLSHHFFSASE